MPDPSIPTPPPLLKNMPLLGVMALLLLAAGFLWVLGKAQRADAEEHCRKAPGTCALVTANDAMHRGMAVTWTGDVDTDFMRSMIPHHQGAVDMAQAVLKYGKDPEVRALAQAVVTTQEKEIAQMKAWLAKHPTPANAGDAPQSHHHQH